MASTLFLVPSTRRDALDRVLNDDVVGRQSRKIREAGTLGGPAGELYVWISGSESGVERAVELLAEVGKRLPPAEAAPIEKAFRDEDDSASAGMGLFFTE